MRKCIKKHKTSRDLIKRADSYIERYRYSKMLKEKKNAFYSIWIWKKTKIITQKKSIIIWNDERRDSKI